MNHHDNVQKTAGGSEINVTVSYQNPFLTVELKDNRGNAPELEVVHEKLIHLIIVSEDLNEYYHLHPVQKDEFTFENEIVLTGDAYKAFVDIRPKGKNYVIESIPFRVGSEVYARRDHSNTALKIDEKMTKEVQGKIVEFHHPQLQVGKDIRLTFDIKNATPQPYLGALGHVVIIDEKVENFIHVHPISQYDTAFDARFDQPGLYKLWAEFKFNEEVVTFPYVIEVE